MIRRFTTRAPAVLAVLALLASPAAAFKKKHRATIAELPAEYQAWLEEVELIISEEELTAFLAIEKDYQRDAFIDSFWRSRDPFPDTARNEFRERWLSRVEEARKHFGVLHEDRSVILLLNGFPDARAVIDCRDLWPAEAWFYQRAENLGHEAALLFYQRGGLGRYRLWQPSDGLRNLFRNALPDASGAAFGSFGGCNLEESAAINAALRFAQAHGVMGFSSIVANLTKRPEGPSGEWASTFNSYTTEVPPDAPPFDAVLKLDFPGRYKARTVVQGVLSVPRSEITVASLGEFQSFNLQLVGEILRGDKLFDNFRYSYNHPLEGLGEGNIPIVFERYLRPGEYSLILRLEDVNGEKFFRTSRQLTVPRVESAFARAASDPETARLLEEANAAIASGETTLKIVPPQGEYQTGKLRLDTLSSGANISEVVFSVDEKQVLKKRSPPWSVEVDLGTLPRMRVLSAVALDDSGREVARDEMTLNAGSHRFDIRLIEPRRGKTYRSSLRAEAEVEVPEDRAVERVEFYLNETLVATLYQEPWVQPIVLPSREQVAYVRVVAYQPDGNSTEDLVFVNAPEYLEEVDIQFVELFIAALDDNQRPVHDLGRKNFTVFEDSVRQKPLRFDQVRNLPIHAGILIDVSASMVDRIEAAKVAALKFFEQAITPKDRAALVTFNDHPNLAAKFTSDVGDLAGGLAGLKAERGTALYDSVIFALYYFNGIKGQRALIILSDGQDEHSRFSFDDTLEYARRAGVAIYSIGLDLSRKEREARRKLRLLAGETGGRLFLIEDVAELEEVYEMIQLELRSRYYLAYQSTNTKDSQEFRVIDVEVDRPRIAAKTLRGYYP